MKRFVWISLVIFALGCTTLKMASRSKSSSLSRGGSGTSVAGAHVSVKEIPKGGKNLEDELYLQQLSEEELLEKIGEGSDMGISINREVQRFIDYYLGRGRKDFLRYRERAERYIPLVKEILRREGLPQDLAYLPILESGYWATALSRSRALGYWQFIRSTARLYGLRIDPWVDERMDIERSTVAAAKYLRDLYARLGSWELAISAYNAGPIRIEEAIKRAGSRDFWVLAHSPYLREETKEYVPRFMAILLLVHNPDLYGLPLPDPSPPLAYDVVKVRGMMDLRRLAKLAGVNYRDLRRLNPALRHWVTPPGPPYPLKVPEGLGAKVSAIASNPAYAGILYPVSDRYGHKWIRHRLLKGESLYLLARSYGVPLSTLIVVNGIRDPRRIRAGKTILIPARADLWVRKGVRGHLVRCKGGSTYVVQEGDTLWHIARLFRVSVEGLMRRNKLQGARIRPGETLLIPPPTMVKKASSRKVRCGKGVIRYRVKKGDNLWSIARAFGVHVRELKRWNGLRHNLIHPGRTLIIYASGGTRKGRVARGKI